MRPSHVLARSLVLITGGLHRVYCMQGIFKLYARAYARNSLGYFGAEIEGLSLSKPITDRHLHRLKDDVTNFEIVRMKRHNDVSPERMLEIARWFGKIDDSLQTDNIIHQKTPHPDILRLSNDVTEGLREFGSRGFHIDGSFLEKPNSHAVYHMIRASKGGTTLFVSLIGVLKHIPRDKLAFWDRLYLARYNYHNALIVYPIIYRHPIRMDKTMCIHLGNLDHFIVDHGGPAETRLTRQESLDIAADITLEFHRDDERFLHRQRWESGELMITDNLAVAHMASADTQLPRSQVGLRILHRVVTKGTTRPSKD